MGKQLSKKKTFADIQFRLGDGTLIAVFISDSLNQALLETDIVELLNQSGYGDHNLEQSLMDNLLQGSKQNLNESIALEAHTNASFSIEISDDQLNATVLFTPAFCGEALNWEDIKSSLLEDAILENKIDDDALKLLVSLKNKTRAIVASGKAVINGDNAFMEILFDTTVKTGPQKLDGGRVNHYETHQYITVEKNQPLIKRTPPTEGEQGETIFGEILNPQPGKDILFEINDSVCIDKNDYNILLASKKGHPIAKYNTVIIDDTLNIANASLESGNVHFDGSVQIKGDVLPNVLVEASGDIFVEGVVENATLIAGNNIVLQSGVVSSQLFEEQHRDSFQPNCRIEARNDIYLKYCNSIHAIAQGSIYIENYSLHSFLDAQVDVIAGINNGKGILLGGRIRAENHIEANVIGSEGYVRTELYCADTLNAKQDYVDKATRVKRIKEELKMLIQLLEQIKQQGTPATVGDIKLQKAKSIYAEVKALQNEFKIEKRKMKRLKKKLKAKQKNVIDVKECCYPNCHIVINDVRAINNKLHKACTISKTAVEILYS